MVCYFHFWLHRFIESRGFLIGVKLFSTILNADCPTWPHVECWYTYRATHCWEISCRTHARILPLWSPFLCWAVSSVRNPDRRGGGCDGPSLCRSTPHIGEPLVTLGSSHYTQVVTQWWQQQQKALPHASECPQVVGSHPHSETDRSRDRASFIFVSSVTGTQQAINKCLLNRQMNDSLSQQWIQKEVHPFPKYILSFIKKLCIELLLHVRRGTKYLECIVTKQRWSLSKWALDESGEGRRWNK